MEEQLSGLPTLFFNSHDMSRAMSRLCHDNQDEAAALAALILTAKGISFLYFGEEIGLPDFIPETIADMRDIQAITHYQQALSAGKTAAQAYDKALEACRDKSRLYMQWNEDEFSGFSTVPPWIGATAPPSLPRVSGQINDPGSLWLWYRTLIALRRHNAPLNSGSYDSLSLKGKLLSFSRRAQDQIQDQTQNQTQNQAQNQTKDQIQDQIIHVYINFDEKKQVINHNNSHEILAGRGINPEAPDQLLPFGILITREKKDVSKTFGK